MTADHTPERLGATVQEVTHLFERVAWKVHDHDGNLVGYHIEADMWREVRAHILAAHLADVEARLAAVEAERANAVAAWRVLSDALSAAEVVYNRMRFDPTANYFDKVVWMQHLADMRVALASAALHPDPSEPT